MQVQCICVCMCMQVLCRCMCKCYAYVRDCICMCGNAMQCNAIHDSSEPGDPRSCHPSSENRVIETDTVSLILMLRSEVWVYSNPALNPESSLWCQKLRSVSISAKQQDSFPVLLVDLHSCSVLQICITNTKQVNRTLASR